MIELQDVRRTYQMGDAEIKALDGVSLRIERGEFVAIMGPSGSGKSTLMHVLGLLDRPDSGSYRLLRREVSELDQDQLAFLRRSVVGFVFQQFNLVPRMDALSNTALPLLYSRHSSSKDQAEIFLRRVGMGDRLHHRPNELSGGQQQRVAIARALMNNPQMILADEPTGNLDSASAREIIGILSDLNNQGITVIMVTHEEDIARQAKRLIRMRDGLVCADERIADEQVGTLHKENEALLQSRGSYIFDLCEHIHQGFKALCANKVRTALSMLGILIGVAAVVAMLALGSGARKAIQDQLASLGSNLLSVRPGAVRVGGVAMEIGAVTRLTLDDVRAVEENLPFVKKASPGVMGRGQVSYLNKNWNTQVLGVGPSYADMRAAQPVAGRFFDEEEDRKRTRVAVVGATVVRELFGDQNPIGERIKINKVSFRIIGLLPERGAAGWRDQDDVILLPVRTAMHRLLGKDYIDYIDIEVAQASQLEAVQQQAKAMMLDRHRVPPLQQQDAFEVRNMADLQAALSQTSRTMSLLLAIIAAISLVVGGIGIMNIMLVSVTERTREIGLRKAIGAQQRDIVLQFMAEATVISTVGGVLGIALGYGLTELMSRLAGWTTSVSTASIALAFAFSAAVGIIFGIYPARKASFLNPIEALRYE